DDRQKIEATMRKDVLDIDRHPLIVFNSTSIDANRVSEGVYQVKIWGDLTLHGTTKSGLIDAQVSFGADRLRAKGSFPLKQSDYGIKRVSVAGGTIKVKDDLRFTFDIVAHPKHSRLRAVTRCARAFPKLRRGATAHTARE
ncbi:MAG TPA: YceI family protein, partial [Blastocatellia bacterium]|nr:YceI family protein [Blastocatellia bacterium]